MAKWLFRESHGENRLQFLLFDPKAVFNEAVLGMAF